MVKESIRYLQNAKDILRKIPIEDGNYTDIKYVRQAFGVAYLALLEAINKALAKKGLIKKDFPKSVDGYRIALRKHFAVKNGKLMRNFESLYDALHLSGYYRARIYNTNAVKSYIKATDDFIKKIS